MLALRQGALGQFQLGLQAHQLKIAARDVGGKQTTGGADIGLAGLDLAQRCVQCGTVFAKEIKFPTGRCLQAAAVQHRATNGRWIDVVGRIELVCQVQSADDFWAVHSFNRSACSLCPCQPCLSDFETRVALQCSAHQSVELRIAKAQPPVAVSRDAVGVYAGVQVFETQGAGVQRLSRGLYAGEIGAGGQRGEGHGAEQQACRASGVEQSFRLHRAGRLLGHWIHGQGLQWLGRCSICGAGIRAGFQIPGR